jgi:hypothetical protein
VALSITTLTHILFLDFIISTEENIMSTIFVDNKKSKTIISEENFTTFVSEEKSTGMYFLLNYRYNVHLF